MAVAVEDISNIKAVSGDEAIEKSLVEVERDGASFYSFKECVDTFFPNIPVGTIKRWLSRLGKRQSKTTSEERCHFAEHGIPGCRFIISEVDLKAIIKYAGKCGRNVSSACMTLDVHDISDATGLVPVAEQTETNLAELESHENSLSDHISEDDAEEVAADGGVLCVSACQDAVQAVSADMNCLDSSELIVENRELPDEQSVCSIEERKTCENLNQNDTATDSNTSSTTETIVEKKALGRVSRLPEHALNGTLKSLMNDLEQFYTVTVQPLRRSKHFSGSTLSKLLERVSCFLNFCRIKYPERSIDFNLVDDFEFVHEYINHLMYERKLCVSTAVRTLSALINLFRYVHRKEANIEACPGFIRLGNIQRQLLHEENSYRLAVQAGLSGDPSKILMYSHVLETLRKLREQLDSLIDGENPKRRKRHDFILIALYVTCMCGRSKELRTLEIFEESKAGREFVFNWKTRCNVLVSSVDGTFILYENDFKTLSSYGPSRMVLDEPKWLLPYLKLYLTERAFLLNGKSHAHMFFGVNGNPFTSSSFSAYLGRLFEREVNIRAGTTKLRHALVTYVLSLKESDSMKLRESLASLMRHSLKHQTSTYNDANRKAKTALSRDVLNKSVENSTFPDSKKRKIDSVPATVGDVCAVLDSVSTSPENANFFLGRVVRISKDGQEALLMEFRLIEGSEASYRACVDSSWWENVNSLIFPLDFVYESNENVYKLRSSAEEIYRTVYPVL